MPAAGKEYGMGAVNLSKAVKDGSAATKLSLIIMGLGNILHGQIIKGLLFLAVEVTYILFMINTGISSIAMLPSLGDAEQKEIYNETLGVYEYVQGDNSLIILLYGVAALFITAGFIIIWRGTVKSAYAAELNKRAGKHNNNIIEDIKGLFDKNLHRLLLTPPVMGILILNILPLIFMICMAFTNYSKIDNKLILFDWVGLKNFAKVLGFKNSIGKTFWSVLGWTIIWAIFATVLNYILGMILAIVINRRSTRGKKIYRSAFMISMAVPQFVSLLVMRSMLSDNGPVNVLLKETLGIIDSPLPFFTDATWARVTVIIINLWVGIPYTMMQVTGILKNIPEELYEAAKVDGASPVKIFFKITLPYMLFVTTPYLITTFTSNINNFNVIFLLSGGNPVPVGETAGKTDLLVTWLYKLTIDQQYYNYGAVIGILTFVVLAVISLVTYRNTGSYKNEEGFQ